MSTPFIGIMTINEVLYWADRMKSLCKANDEEVEDVRAAIKVFFLHCGLNAEGLHRENWVEANQVRHGLLYLQI